MSYLSLLEQEKAAKDKYEEEELLLRVAITDCNNLFSLHDGDFLEKLQLFIKNYKIEKQANNQ